MLRRTPLTLDRLIARMAMVAAPRHRHLVRAMLSELDSISDRAERRRFAMGAIAAIVRLALGRLTTPVVHAKDQFASISNALPNTDPGVRTMPSPSARQLLRRHVVPFAVTLVSLTALLLANGAARLLPQLRARGASAGTFPEMLLLAMPSILALTIPMAVFIAVAWVFTRLGREGVLAAARREPHGLRRLISPVLAAATLFAGLTFVSNTEILPRANARYTAVLAQRPVAPNDRSMTISELREAARNVLADNGPGAAARAAAYEVEVQKKFALAAACLVLALAGAAIALRFPRGGLRLVIGASGALFVGYYLSLIAGEALADQRLLPPVAAMWLANILVLAVVLLLVWRPFGPGGGRVGTLATGG